QHVEVRLEETEIDPKGVIIGNSAKGIVAIELTQLPDGAMEEVGMVHHQGHAVAFGKRHQLLPLCYAGAHRLFDKDMLVLHKRAARESKVGGGGGGDHHSLDLRVVDQLRGVGI